jgi:hypothetical protein
MIVNDWSVYTPLSDILVAVALGIAAWVLGLWLLRHALLIEAGNIGVKNTGNLQGTAPALPVSGGIAAAPRPLPADVRPIGLTPTFGIPRQGHKNCAIAALFSQPGPWPCGAPVTKQGRSMGGNAGVAECASVGTPG